MGNTSKGEKMKPVRKPADEKVTRRAVTYLLNQMLTDACRIRTPDGHLVVIVKGEHVKCLDAWYDEHMQPAVVN